MVRRSTAGILLWILMSASLLQVNAGMEDLTAWRTLHASDGDRGDAFGHALDVDGDWMVAGAPLDDSTANQAGSAYFFQRIGGEWEEQQRVELDVSSSDNFGFDVAIDGKWAAISAPFYDHGLVQLYELRGDTWHAAAIIEATTGERFGWSLAMDGDYLMVGAPGTEFFQPLAPAGQVYLYERSGTSWALKDTVTKGGLGSTGQFGYSVDLDGARSVVGSPSRYFEDEVQPGSIWFFDIASDAFVDRGQHSASFGFDEYGQYGGSVALDGDNAIVTDDLRYGFTPISFAGDLFAYERRGTQWVEILADFYYGHSVDIEGDHAVIGSWAWGEVLVLEKQDGNWESIHGVSRSGNSDFGFDVALEDGTLYVGSPTDDSPADRDAGTVEIFLQGVNPIADAGPDLDLMDLYNVGSVDVSLDGSGSIDDDGTIVLYEWWEGSTRLATGEEATVSLDVGRHRIDLIVEDDDGLRDKDRVTIDVDAGPEAEADFQWSPKSPKVGQKTTFHDLSVHPTETLVLWDWDFDGDGNTDATGRNPLHAFSESGSQAVSLTVTSNGGDSLSATKKVTVANAPPTAMAGPDIIVDDTNGDQFETVTLDGGASRDDEGNIQSYTWKKGAVTLGNAATIDVDLEVGYHNIDLVVSDDDGARDTDRVVVLVTSKEQGKGNATAYVPPGPVTDFDWRNTGNTFPHRHIQFTDKSTAPDADVIMWHWDFGDGTQSTDRHPTHVYTTYGSFLVSLQATDSFGTASSFDQMIEVKNQDPTARFSLAAGTISPDTPVVFHDQSSDPEEALLSWRWNFGEGSTSSRQDVGHTFTRAGAFNVTLTVTDDGGLSDTHHFIVQVGQASEGTATDGESVDTGGEAIHGESDPSGDGQQSAGDEGEPEDDASTSGPKQAISAKLESIDDDLPFPWWMLLVLAAVLILSIVVWRQRASPKRRVR